MVGRDDKNAQRIRTRIRNAIQQCAAAKVDADVTFGAVAAARDERDDDSSRESEKLTFFWQSRNEKRNARNTHLVQSRTKTGNEDGNRQKEKRCNRLHRLKVYCALC